MNPYKDIDRLIEALQMARAYLVTEQKLLAKLTGKEYQPL